uniref:Uncharacterized protein n=1 Tax=Tetranychus urticae TaxID=32264 RepID=A0A158P5E7_TETUR
MTVKQAVEIYPTLQKLARTKKKTERKSILSSCPCKVFHVLSEIARNILKGVIKVPRHKLKSLKVYKNDLRKIAKQKNSSRIKRTLIQKRGFLPLLIKPALSLLASIVASKMMKK